MSQSIINASEISSKQLVVIDEKDLNDEHILKLKNKPHILFFVRQRFHTSQIRLDEDNDELIYIPTKIVPMHTSMQYIINSLKDFCILLVEDDHDQFVGYIDGYLFSKHMFTQYKHSQAFLETIIETMDESCTVIDQNKCVLYWSKGSEKLFSIKAEEIIGQPITNFFDQDRLKILNSLHYGQSLHKKQHKPFDNYLILINSNPVYVDNKIVGAVSFEQDITQQVQLNNELYQTSKNLFKLEKEVYTNDPFRNIQGRSDKMKQTLRLMKRAALTDAPVLIQGESGLGKDLFAKAVHNLRESSTAPFVAINCGAIPESIFESEIFGFETTNNIKGTNVSTKGKIELADQGTLFLENIETIPLEIQEKLLRVLQEKKLFRLGGNEKISVNFRLIVTANTDLEKLVQEGMFNEQLFYRLNVINIAVPPLRERPEDIIELTHYYLHEYSVKYNRPIHGISQETMQALLQHHWPGNIRELKNVIERLIVFSENGEINWRDLPFYNSEAIGESEATNEQLPLNSVHSNLPLKKQLEIYEKEIIIRKLAEVNNNKKVCAKKLGITRATLYNRMNRLGIDL